MSALQRGVVRLRSSVLLNPALWSCCFYSLASTSMVLLNKVVMSSYSFDFPLALIFTQSLMSVLFIAGGRRLGWLECESLNRLRVLQWLPVSVAFVVMLFTSLKSLQLLSVPIVMVFKNTNNVFIAAGDYVLFGQRVSFGVLCTMALMVLASILAASEDLEFDWGGYNWMAANCVSATAYVLYMRHAMRTTKLSHLGLVYYNSCLTLPLIVLGDILFSFGDFARLYRVAFTEDRSVGAAAIASGSDFVFSLFRATAPMAPILVMSGINGFALSLSSFLCVEKTSPTTYSMVGSLNKVRYVLYLSVCVRAYKHASRKGRNRTTNHGSPRPVALAS